MFGDVTTGAQDDIRKATDLARRMVTSTACRRRLDRWTTRATDRAPLAWGLGPRVRAGRKPRNCGADRAGGSRLPRHVPQASRDILRDNREILERMTQELLQVEVLDGERMDELLAEVAAASGLAEPPVGRRGGARHVTVVTLKFFAWVPMRLC